MSRFLLSVLLFGICLHPSAHALPRLTFVPTMDWKFNSLLEERNVSDASADLVGAGAWRDFGYRCERVCTPTPSGGTLCQGTCGMRATRVDYAWQADGAGKLAWGDGREWAIDAPTWAAARGRLPAWVAFQHAQETGLPIAEIRVSFLSETKIRVRSGAQIPILALDLIYVLEGGGGEIEACIWIDSKKRGLGQILGIAPDNCPFPISVGRVEESQMVQLPWAENGASE